MKRIGGSLDLVATRPIAMEIVDFELVLKMINKGSHLPTSLQANPVDQITFNDGPNLEAFLNQSEKKTYQLLEKQLQEVTERLQDYDQQLQMEGLVNSLEETLGNLSALAMTATFREGLFKGFRLAQFFLLGNYQQKTND